MTKLTEWLCGLTAYFSVWFSLIWKRELRDNFDYAIYFLPVFTVIMFGIYSVAVVLWRVYTFNDCPEAAEELQSQIKQAKEDLKAKGLKF